MKLSTASSRVTMRPFPIVLLCAFLLAAPALHAQQNNQENLNRKPLRIQIVLSEYDGEKKIANLPYSIAALTPLGQERNYYTLRAGVRVPVALESKDSKYHYEDMGTILNCRVEGVADGRYLLDITVDRSSVLSRLAQNKGADWTPGQEGLSNLPLTHGFRSNFEVLVPEGQSVEGPTGTDPISGHTYRVDVAVNSK